MSTPQDPSVPPDNYNIQRIRVWGAVIVSSLVSVVFCVALFIAYWKGQQDGIELMIGALVAQFSAAVSYWIGSSVGSQQKDHALIERRPSP